MSKNTSKNKLLPFAVLDMNDLRIEIGQDNPKQSIVNASSNSVIKEIFIFFSSIVDFLFLYDYNAVQDMCKMHIKHI